MKRIAQTIFIFTLLIGLSTTKASAQLDSLLNKCSSYIKFPFISDGQEYRALVTNGETAEFYITFYGGATYRIAACTGNGSTSPIFKIYDKNRKLLFSSDNFNNPQYWDIKFTSTVDCIIEAELPPTGPSSGFIVIYIGFK